MLKYLVAIGAGFHCNFDENDEKRNLQKNCVCVIQGISDWSKALHAFLYNWQIAGATVVIW
jgi:hypothetical protein